MINKILKIMKKNNEIITPAQLEEKGISRIYLSRMEEEGFVERIERGIYVTKDFDLDSVKVLKTDAPIVFDKLQQQKHAIWNECMTFLGVNNANMDKRERLVDDEVQANNEQVGISAEVMLKSREYACEQINKLFGTKISVKRRQFNAPLLDDTEPKEDENDVR